MPEANSAQYGSLPFNESIDFFRNKLNVPTERWADIWQSGHNSGFMVAGALKNDLLNDFRQAVDSAIAQGKSITWFKSEFKKIVARHGWSHTGDASWRSKIIYDTNMRQSYNAGRFNQLQHFDYWLYKHGDSITPRPMHLSWDGLLLPKSDPWWKTHFPQNGWGCKCKAFGRSQAQVDRQNLKVNKRPNDGSVEWTDKTTGEIHQVPKGIDPGFDYAPQKSAINKRQQESARKKAKIFTEPNRIVPSVFSTVPAVNVKSLNNLLDKLQQTSSAPQVLELASFLKQHNTKTLFIKEDEINPKNRKAMKIKQEIKSYLNSPFKNTVQLYTNRNYRKTLGFTSRSFEHVVIKVKSSQRLNQADINEIRQSIAAALLLKQSGRPAYTYSSILQKFSENNTSHLMTTWLHEIGHQIHYKAGSPQAPLTSALTDYPLEKGFNNNEWHAEMFVAWLLGRKTLLNWNRDIAEYMDQLVKRAIENE